MRKKRDAIAGRALVIDRNYVHSVLASDEGKTGAFGLNAEFFFIR